MNRHHPAITVGQATRLARGHYRKIRLRCAFLGFFVCLAAALSVLDSPLLALTAAAAVGVPLGVAVLVPALGFVTFRLLESGYGPNVARRARHWALRAAAGDRFDLARILQESAADLLQAIRPHDAHDHRGTR